MTVLTPKKQITENILSKVTEDLNPSIRTAAIKVGIATVIGGIASLLLCGQFGFSFTPFGIMMNHYIHSKVGAFNCALICGSLYSIIPVLSLRLFLCHPIQFRVILSRYWYIMLGWMSLSGVILHHLSHHERDLLASMAWVVAAFFSAMVFSKTLSVLVPKSRLQLGPQYLA